MLGRVPAQIEKPNANSTDIAIPTMTNPTQPSRYGAPEKPRSEKSERSVSNNATGGFAQLTSTGETRNEITMTKVMASALTIAMPIAGRCRDQRHADVLHGSNHAHNNAA